ncbi:MAG: ABC transporter ATP-binding protein [Propionibacteriaceae bacterium]|jgi:thiamine transport system ATP-binding protein|nr:ABC transporter ATP-binding protein [Propionibacteriaceae bacterium]
MVSEGLTVNHIAVKYGQNLVVDDFSLTLAPGEIIALLGPSGSGKSTILRAIAGLEPLVAGSIAWDGVDVTHVPTHKRGFVLMFQDGQLFPHLDVAGNVAYGINSLPGPTRDARVAELLELVGLADYGKRPITALSGGEAQRVALARSLAPVPKVLLLDEPLSSLDTELRGRLAAEIRTMIRARDTAAIYVTHDTSEADAVADRVVLLQ